MPDEVLCWEHWNETFFSPSFYFYFISYSVWDNFLFLPTAATIVHTEKKSSEEAQKEPGTFSEQVGQAGTLSLSIDLMRDAENSSSPDHILFIKTLWVIDEKVWKIFHTGSGLAPLFRAAQLQTCRALRSKHTHCCGLCGGTEHTDLLVLPKFTRIFTQGASHKDF